MLSNRNTFTGGMDQDTSKSRQDGKHYFKGQNIKIITQEGLSSGNVENEDGNKLSFNIPDTFGFWKVRFNNPENPSPGTLTIQYTDPTTNLSTSYITSIVDSIEELVVEINSGLSSLIGNNVKVIKNGEFVYIIPLDSTIINVTGSQGLSDNNGTQEVTAQSNLKIIGWGVIREYVVVFTTNETSQTPVSAGQIWKFEYDPITNQVKDLAANNDLSIKDHLIYNNKLNFSTYWHIGTETIGHYENSNTAIIYFTDEYNNLRAANILDSELLGKSPSQLNITEGIDFSIPVISGVTDKGSLPDGATVQYAYRLFSENGRVSSISPLSNPIPLGNFDPSSDTPDNRAWEGDGSNSLVGDKAVEYTISNIDTSFNFIEHIAIFRTGLLLDIYKFDEEAIPSDGNLTVIHSDRNLDIPLTEVDLANITRSFKRCKTITVKDKRLVAGNVDIIDTSLDGYDTRAYRFSSLSSNTAIDRKALLNDKELPSITLNGSSPSYSSVPEDFDAINPYNKETSETNNQYKYKADGITLGGEGPNISYKFVTQDIPLKATVSGKISQSGVPSGPGSGIYNTKHINRNSQQPINSSPTLNNEVRGNINEFQNFKSPTMSGAFVGYSRGEVYRMGITFYDKEGNPFNTKWIGDIKIPESYEKVGNDYPFAIAGENVNAYDQTQPIMGKSIGIEFDVDISSIQDNISGYEIVRVKRLKKDKTRLGTGIWNNFTQAPRTEGRRYDSEVKGSITTVNGIKVAVGTSRTKSDSQANMDIDGQNYNNVFILDDTPELRSGDTGAPQRKTGVVIAPTSIMRGESEYSYKTGDKLKTLGFYSDLYEGGTEFQGVNTDSDGESIVSYLILGREWYTDSSVRETKEMVREQVFAPGQIVTSSFSGPVSTNIPFVNCSCSTGNEKAPLGIGDIKQLVEISTVWTRYNRNTAFPAGPVVPASVAKDNVWEWREVSYERELVNQYGGDTFEARSRNIYIATGSFEQVKDYFNSTRTRVVFGGDVYVTQFNYQYFYTNYSSVTPEGLNDADGKPKYHLGMSFPCETPLNTEYMENNSYGDQLYRDWMSTGSFGDVSGPAAYSMPAHYQFQNEGRQVFFPEGFIDNNATEFPHRLWASNKKIDGELLDSWRIFLINNFSEVEGQYGEINKIITIQDRFLFYQDRAMGAASINDRAIINDENGVALTLGNGGILDSYKYISRKTGTKHKFSVVSTGISVHHFDAILKKWYRYSQGPSPLSDIKGLHSHFLEYNGELLKSDRILDGKGIHGVYDRIRNKVYMTFLNAKNTPSQSINSDLVQANTIDNYTIIYDELLQGYDQFSDCIPSLWLETDGKLLTCEINSSSLPRPYDPLNSSYLQYEGEKNNFYGIVYPSVIEILINPKADITCVMNTLEFKSEIFINDIEQPSLTFDSLRVLNDHQDSGTISLVVDSNIVRRFRSWRTNIPRDINSPGRDARMRDYYIKLVLSHTPSNNERLVLHDIITNYVMMPH
jgi:hypothetical protein